MVPPVLRGCYMHGQPCPNNSHAVSPAMRPGQRLKLLLYLVKIAKNLSCGHWGAF
jgi:hypothetical protein